MAWQPKGTFDHQWFTNLTAPLWDRYIEPLVAKIDGPINYLEIGVAEAQSMLYALEHFGRVGGYFVGIDPFLDARNWHVGEGKKHQDRAKANIAGWFGMNLTGNPGADTTFYGEGKPTCELMVMSSLSYMLCEHDDFNVCYVDGGHEAPTALADMIQCWRVLKLGGLMIVDDAERRYRGGMPSVAVAIDAFEHVYHGYFDVVFRHPKQVCYVKRNKRRRGQYPPTMVAVESIIPTGPVGDE